MIQGYKKKEVPSEDTPIWVSDLASQTAITPLACWNSLDVHDHGLSLTRMYLVKSVQKLILSTVSARSQFHPPRHPHKRARTLTAPVPEGLPPLRLRDWRARPRPKTAKIVQLDEFGCAIWSESFELFPPTSLYPSSLFRPSRNPGRFYSREEMVDHAPAVVFGR